MGLCLKPFQPWYNPRQGHLYKHLCSLSRQFPSEEKASVIYALICRASVGTILLVLVTDLNTFLCVETSLFLPLLPTRSYHAAAAYVIFGVKTDLWSFSFAPIFRPHSFLDNVDNFWNFASVRFPTSKTCFSTISFSISVTPRYLVSERC